MKQKTITSSTAVSPKKNVIDAEEMQKIKKYADHLLTRILYELKNDRGNTALTFAFYKLTELVR